MAKVLADKLNFSENNIYLDTRNNRKWQSFSLEVSKALSLFDLTNENNYSMLIQDDVDICNNFINLCLKIISYHKNAIFSLFPYAYMNMFVKEKILNRNSPYWEADIVSGCCIIIPNIYMKDLILFMQNPKTIGFGDYVLISCFASANKIPVLTTIPSLVQHIGDVSILDPTKPIRKTQYFEMDPVANWESQEVNSLKKIQLS